MELPHLSDTDLIQHFSVNAPHMMWFLGAGTSRTAGMPTAIDIIWELKRKHYCIKENQDIRQHDINNDAVKRKIQSYMDSKGFPAAWSSEEYSFYFDLTFGADYAAQQKFLLEQLAPEKVSLNIGHRALAGLLTLQQTQMIFTTNFDEVIEKAYAQVAGDVLPTFHLEGSYAALDALNAARLPIYAKIHGDFRYQKIKNLTQDLLNNDEQIRKCLITASSRYGMIVSGYSGRDENVMAMFHEALRQTNAFPHGLYWTVPQLENILPSVVKLFEAAKEKKVKAFLVETGTFDILMSKIWKQIPARTDEIDKKVRTATAKEVAIPLPKPGKRYPLIRTNGLPVTGCPITCAQIELTNFIKYGDLQQAIADKNAKVVMTKTDKILAWGSPDEMRKVFEADRIKSLEKHEIIDPVDAISNHTLMKVFYEGALARALQRGKPLLLNHDGNRYSLVVDSRLSNNPVFQPLKQAVGFKGKPGWLTGKVKDNNNATWAESVGIRLEEKEGSLILLLTPNIWISPSTERENCFDFLRGKRIFRYNNIQNDLLDAWIKLLFGDTGAQEVEISCFLDTDFPAKFTISTRSVFTSGEVLDAA